MDDTEGNATTTATQGPSGRARLWLIVGAVVVVLLTILYVFGLMYKPAYGADKTANSAVRCSGTTCTVHLQIQPSVGGTGAGGPHSNWLGYQTDTSPVHPGTLLTLPRNATVTFVIRNFDSVTAPRNEFFSLVQGTVGGVEYVNGKKVHVMNPADMSHTFTIPDFGVSVPMLGVPDSGKPPFQTMKFTIHTPNKTGVFRWQCIVPCGSGLYGFGGAMGELGYMQGLITLT